MSNSFLACVSDLMANSEEEFLNSANVLIKIARNIEDNPGVEKYKSIKIGSNVFMNSILPIAGAIQCLYQMGFVEDGDRYVFAGEQHDKNLNNIKTQLEIAVSRKQNQNVDIKPAYCNVLPEQHIIASESTMYNKMCSHYEHVLIYEDNELQQKARSAVPLSTLERRARERLSKSPEFSNSKSITPLKYQDCLLLELLHWFKHEFFTWTDAPKCNCCSCMKPSSIGMLNPTSEELRWWANRVEGYQCQQCKNVMRFPRYNHPGKLLETRAGRCGEWANCFCLLCRSLGFDTRHVIDWTDHVWAEVYSHTVGRWLHCDPCENAFDRPLMYEQGWGKRLCFVLAVSREEIVDVTWRYVQNLPDVIQRRKNMFRETWLRSKISELCLYRKAGLGIERRKEIEVRFIKEMVELASPKAMSNNGYGGRTTGSFQWRKARGELGSGPQLENTKVIQPNKEELTSKLIKISYFSSSDKYSRKSSTGETLGWESFVNVAQNIERKVEEDWRMAYLARTPSSKTAHISWKIDLSNVSHDIAAPCVIKETHITVTSTVFESGRVKWFVCTNKSVIQINPGANVVLKKEVEGSSVISLHAFLEGGEGENAWQHTQLFRQSLEDESNSPKLNWTVLFMTS